MDPLSGSFPYPSSSSSYVSRMGVAREHIKLFDPASANIRCKWAPRYLAGLILDALSSEKSLSKIDLEEFIRIARAEGKLESILAAKLSYPHFRNAIGELSKEREDAGISFEELIDNHPSQNAGLKRIIKEQLGLQ